MTPDARQEQLLAGLGELGEDAERQLLDFILREGFDQGCFIRPDPEDLIYGLPDMADRLGRLAARAPQEPRVEDPFERSALAETSIEGREPGFMILTQRCDLVRPICQEPCVELAAVHHCVDDATIVAASLNSPRWLRLDSDDGGAWIVDLRCRALLPKHLLPKTGAAVLPLQEGRARRHLAQRIGRRYSRRPVPTDIVEGIQRPLASYLKSNKKRRRQSELFMEFLAVRRGGEILLLGLIGRDADRVKATIDFRDILAKFGPLAGLPIAAESDAVTAVDIPLDLALDDHTHKLDMDQLTWSSKASEQAAEPSH